MEAPPFNPFASGSFLLSLSLLVFVASLSRAISSLFDFSPSFQEKTLNFSQSDVTFLYPDASFPIA